MGVAGYRVLRKGAQVAQVTGLSDRDDPGRGTFVHTLFAFDTAANASPASNAITVRL